MTIAANPGKLALDRIALLRALLGLLDHKVAPADANHRPASIEYVKIGDVAVITTRSKRHYGLITAVNKTPAGAALIDVTFLTRAAIRTSLGFYDPRVTDPQFGEILAAQAERSTRASVDGARRLGHIQHHVARAFRHMPYIAFAQVTTRALSCDLVDIVYPDDSDAQRRCAVYAAQFNDR